MPDTQPRSFSSGNRPAWLALGGPLRTLTRVCKFNLGRAGRVRHTNPPSARLSWFRFQPNRDQHFIVLGSRWAQQAVEFAQKIFRASASVSSHGITHRQPYLNRCLVRVVDRHVSTAKTAIATMPNMSGRNAGHRIREPYCAQVCKLRDVDHHGASSHERQIARLVGPLTHAIHFLIYQDFQIALSLRSAVFSPATVPYSSAVRAFQLGVQV